MEQIRLQKRLVLYYGLKVLTIILTTAITFSATAAMTANGDILESCGLVTIKA